MSLKRSKYILTHEPSSPERYGRSQSPRGDYFTKTREYLSALRKSAHSPRAKGLLSPASRILGASVASPSRSPHTLRKSQKTPHRVKFDLDESQLSARKRNELALSTHEVERYKARQLNDRMHVLEEKMDHDLKKSMSPKKIRDTRDVLRDTRDNLNTSINISRTSYENPDSARSSRKLAASELRNLEAEAYYNKLRAQESAQQLSHSRSKSRDMTAYKKDVEQKIVELQEEIEVNKRRHLKSLEKTERNIEHTFTNRLEEYEHEIRHLKSRVRELEHRLENRDKDYRNLEDVNNSLTHEHRAFVSRLEDQITTMKATHHREVQDLVERHEEEKKKMKVTYDKLIHDMTIEIRQLYDRTNEEIQRKEIEMKQNEIEKDLLINKYRQQYEAISHDFSTIQETSRLQKRIIEDNKTELIKVSSQLEDKKRELLLTQSKIGLFGSAEKSGLDSSRYGSSSRFDRSVRGFGTPSLLSSFK